MLDDEIEIIKSEFPSPATHLTLREFCIHHGITLEQSKVSGIGKKMSARSKDVGAEVRKRFDERYGSVNTYDIKILREEFKEYDLPHTCVYITKSDQEESEDLADGMKQYIAAMKKGVWIDATGKEHNISEMNTRHMKATMSMLDRDHWPANIAKGYKKLFAEEIKKKPKKDVSAEELSERLMSAENNMWKSGRGLVKYEDMSYGHIEATIKMIKRFDWPDVLKDAYLDGMTAELKKRG